MRFLAVAIALLLTACSGASDDDAKYKQELAAATHQARDKLPWFWEHFEAPQVDEYDFSLKVALPRKDGQAGAEDAWVEQLARGNDKLVGQLMTDPKYLGAAHRGDIVEFKSEQIVDWAFLRGEELIGHYTTRVMLPHMPPEQADGLKSMFGENPK